MKYLSNSEMKTWRRCRRQWWLSYHRGLRRRGHVDFNRPLGIGNRVHECLEHYYDPTASVSPAEWLDYTLARDLAAHPAHEADIRKEYDLCKAMIDGYVEWLAETGADQAFTVVASETAMTAPIDADTSLVSKIDVRIHHEEFGVRLAMDHKTVGALTPPAILRQDTQMLTEHLVEYIARPGDEHRARGVLYNMLKKSKRTARATGPFYHREPIRHNENELRRHWQHVLRVAQEIADAERNLDAGVDHHSIVYPNPTGDCSWDCPFLKVCPMFDDGSDAEGALATAYEVGDPLERYRGLLPELPRTDKADG